MPSEFLSRFTTHLRDALQKGLSFALENGRELVEPSDMLVGLLMEKGSIGCEILNKGSVTLEEASRAFRGYALVHDRGVAAAPDLSAAVKRLLEKCVLTAHVHEHKYIGTEHLLSALLESPLPEVHRFLKEQGFSFELAREQITNILKSTSHFPDLTPEEPSEHPHDMEPTGPSEPHQKTQRGAKLKMLEAFARQLTAPDVVITLDPVIGRDQEIDRVIEILCRRLKNNPILLGEPGVGKTAIVEGLAKRLAAGDVPDLLQGKRLMAVDLALLVAGTMYRGEFEARLKQLVDEAKQDNDVILFIDEIHTIVGAGSTSGSLDAANILKPALARGEIRCIGATTWSEFKKHLEPDAALERRYQPVDVQEPTTEQVARMIEGVRSRYEHHHGVRYAEEALRDAVVFAERYLADRFFPDKAFDVIDEAGASVSVQRRSSDTVERLRSLEIAIAVSREAKEEAMRKSALDQAASAQQDEARLLEEKKSLTARIQQERATSPLMVTREDVARIVARMARVPVEVILQTEREQVAMLEQVLGTAVLGQREPVRFVAEAVTRARLGFGDPLRPRASLLFVGPSGVGKTALARALARHLFGREDQLVKLDMSEFSEGHSIAKLLGSPAGYVGYREGNRLTDVIRKHPHAVLLFDEFEKAHTDVQHLLLQGLEDGRITDATGRHVSLRHAYIVLTSNVGSEFVNRRALGFDGAENASTEDAYQSLVRQQLSDRFRPELLNRLDRIVVFQPLDHDTLKEIIRRELDLVLARSQETLSVAYAVGESVIDWLASRPEGQAEDGARAARKIVEREVT